MKFSILNFLAAVLLTVPAFASKVVEDSQNRYVIDDVVASTETFDCPSGGSYFLPEDASYDNGNGLPVRHYQIAVPSKDIPRVSVSDLKTLDLGKNWCGDPEKGIANFIKFMPVSASQPQFKDGLWISDVRVPLYLKKGASVSLRREFRVEVEFSGKASGVNPGARGLARVSNPVGATRFGILQGNQVRKLRKEAVNQTSNVNFLAQFLVGDKNIGSFAEDGLYAVDFKSIRVALMALQRQGELESGIPVDKICVFGASPDTLSSVGPGSSERNPNQIFEIPIEVRDHSPGGSSPDGIFNEGDSLVFVGYGNGFWKRGDREDASFKNGKMDYFHSYSPYSFYQSFLFGWKESGKGLRLAETLKSPSGKAADVRWMRYVRAEKDAILRDTYFGRDLDWESSTGKEWFWLWHSRLDSTHVSASTLKTTETSSLPGLIDGGDQFVAVSYFPHRSIWKSGAMVKGDQMSDQKLSGGSYAVRMGTISFSLNVNGTDFSGEESTLMPGGNFRVDGVRLQKSGNSYALDMLPNAAQFDRFDGYSVAYQWTPVVDSAEWLLPGAITGVVSVPVPSGTDVVKFKNLQPVGVLASSNGVAKDSVSASDDVRYLAVRKNTFRSGLKVQGLPLQSQNVLSDLSRPNSKLEYLIIAPKEFVNEAVALAEFRSDGSAVSTVATSVVSLEDIYQRYTAGRPSPVAVRNFLSYVYSVCPNFRYVLLVGSATYDYKGFNASLSPNYMPSYEIEDGVYDDFFGVLDSGEVLRYGYYDLDVAVGRIPAQTPSELAYYVQKVKDYEKLGTMDYSSWRSNLLLSADDAYNNGREDGTAHTRFQENLARMIDSLSAMKGERWTMKKVYLLDYDGDAAGQKKEAADDFINVLNQGALFATYFGHGSKTDWAAEGLMKPGYISKMTNKGRYTILGSFSCTVGRFDEGNIKSLSEEMLLAPGAGSIASIGATRETFASFNSIFGNTLLKYALVEDLSFLGEAFLKAKASGSKEYTPQRYNNERYVLLGEPVLRMPALGHKIRFDNSLKTLKALDKVSLSGRVDGMEKGSVHLSINEGRAAKSLNLQIEGDSSIDVFYDGAMIYSEEVPVNNGRFATEFITPRKMTIGDSAAELKAWAYDSKSSMIGRTWIHSILVDGQSDYVASLNDTTPPSIQVQSCYSGAVATNFADGQTVKLQSPACLQVVIEDSTALDFREQADEGISFEIAGVKDPFHPWPYLEQSSKRAKIRMNFSTDLYPAGTYVFIVRALDVLGNASSKVVCVEISDDMEMGLADVFNAPNPMGKKGTTFYFKNLAVDRDSKVNIFIYNQNGKLVKVLKNAISGVTHWNGKDEHGRLLANGLYHYVVRSEVPATENFGKKNWTKKQKLLISR